MMERDDWLSPAAFVARIDLDAKRTDVTPQVKLVQNQREAFRQALSDLGHAEATVFGHWALVAYDKVHNLELYDSAKRLADSVDGAPPLKIVVPRVIPVTLVNASYQAGCQLMVNPLTEPLEAGQIVTIDEVFEWRRTHQESAADYRLRQFALTKLADIGNTVLCIYPPIYAAEGGEIYRTVVDLPMNHACVRKVLPSNAG